MAAIFVIYLILVSIALSYAAQCGKIFDNKVSEADAKIILDKHNELRKLIANEKVPDQPRGTNLKRMKYDNKLAAAAQKIANSCEFAHKHVDDGRWHAVGQNLYISMSTGRTGAPDWDTAIQSWFDEYRMYRFGRCCSTGTGHYTQIVWANTEFVGCGYTFYDTKSFWKYQKLYVCNYGPAGNYIGQYPYETGKSGCENLC